MAAIHGPLAPLNMNKEEEKAIVSVVIKSGRQDKSSALEYEWGEFLCSVLSSCMDRDRYPRSVVEVVLQIIQGDGSVLSCLLHAAVAALMDAGIELLYLPVATTCLVHDTILSNQEESQMASSSSNSAIYLDPSGAEEEEANTSIIVLVNETTQPDRILGSHTIGNGLPLEKMLTCVQVAAKACPAIVAFWRLAVEQKVTRESQTLWSK
jgi:ribonuclease PH